MTNRKKYWKKYYQENKEKELDRAKKYRKKNVNYLKEYYKKNIEKLNKKMKEWRENNKERKRKMDKNWILKNQVTEEFKKKKREMAKKLYKKYPERFKARNKTSKIKISFGILCERCKENLATEKHHPDYSKPLEIIFLCKNCHIQLHMRINTIIKEKE